MKQRTVTALMRQIESTKLRIAAERDKLRDIIDELQSIEEDCEESIDDLNRAADALRRLL